MSDVWVKICRLKPLTALPTYATPGSVGLDLQAAINHVLVLAPRDRAAIPTGIALALPSGYEGQVRPRSGLARKHGIGMVNAPGTIDEDFRGEIHAVLINLGDELYEFHPGDRIAQLVIVPVPRVVLEEVSSLEDLGQTVRGASGFGSTGIR
jgi:dUTP pyrophosphatase